MGGHTQREGDPVEDQRYLDGVPSGSMGNRGATSETPTVLWLSFDEITGRWPACIGLSWVKNPYRTDVLWYALIKLAFKNDANTSMSKGSISPRRRALRASTAATMFFAPETQSNQTGFTFGYPGCKTMTCGCKTYLKSPCLALF